jgi:hypothetical protein
LYIDAILGVFYQTDYLSAVASPIATNNKPKIEFLCTQNTVFITEKMQLTHR